MLKIRRPLGRLIFNMGIAIPGKTVFLIETAPWLYQYFFTKEQREFVQILDYEHIKIKWNAGMPRDTTVLNSLLPRKPVLDDSRPAPSGGQEEVTMKGLSGLITIHN